MSNTAVNGIMATQTNNAAGTNGSVTVGGSGNVNAAGIGIDAQVTGANNTGSVTVTRTGNVTATGIGINAAASGGGNVTVTGVGNVGFVRRYRHQGDSVRRQRQCSGRARRNGLGKDRRYECFGRRFRHIDGGPCQ